MRASVPTTRRQRPAVVGDDLDLGRALDDVIVGDDLAIGGNEEAGALAHAHLPPCRRGSALGMLKRRKNFSSSCGMAHSGTVLVLVRGLRDLDLHRHDGRTHALDDVRKGDGASAGGEGGGRRRRQRTRRVALRKGRKQRQTRGDADGAAATVIIQRRRGPRAGMKELLLVSIMLRTS